MEKIIPFLTLKPNATFLKINLSKLSENFKEFRKIIPNQTKVMLMLKAAGYGNGTWEIAQILERENVDYLAVAYTSEGIDLRQKNVKLPILVLNPDSTSLEQLINFDLEPSVGSLEFLKLLQRTANYANKKLKIHLEFDTGMGRLGFFKHEINEILEHLAESLLIPVSIFSHLAASDEPEHDDFTRKQIADFQEFTLPFKQKYPELIRHILNTAGIFRFPEAYFEMVRIGIGLYGIPPIEKSPIFLQEIGTLQTVISQIHTYTEKTSISYSRSQFVEKDSVIATIPIGYADGIPRRLSGGKMNCLVHGQKVPVVGKICMDMLMLDITKVKNVKEGDEVVIFGEQENEKISIQEFAKQADTISYEILTGISSRVRRVYFKE